MLHPLEVLGRACKGEIECDNQVYTNNYNEHVAVREANIKCYEERRENKKDPVPDICRYFTQRRKCELRLEK